MATGKLLKLAHESDGWVGELERRPPARVWVSVATKQQPLVPRGRAAHALIAYPFVLRAVLPAARAFLYAARTQRSLA